MSRVFTANVFITKSAQAIEQLFFGENKISSFKSRLEYLKKEELSQSFIVSPENNQGMLEFEYSFGGLDGESNSKVVATFVETSKSLEFLLLDDPPTVKKLKHAIELKNKKTKPYEDATSNFNFLSKGKQKDTSSALDRLKASNRYYFAFGVGDDLSTWDGPHSMDLAGATLSNDDANNREVTVTFVANADTLKSWTRQFEKEMGYGNAIKKFNQSMQEKSFTKNEGTATFNLKKVEEAETRRTSGSKYRQVAPSQNPITGRIDLQYEVDMVSSTPTYILPIYEFDSNKGIREVLRNFIGSVTQSPGNVVVAFPHKLQSLRTSSENKSPWQLELDDPSKKYLNSLGINPTFNGPRFTGSREDYLKKIGNYDAVKTSIDEFNFDLDLKQDERERLQREANLNAGKQQLTEELKNSASRNEWREWLQVNDTVDRRRKSLGIAYSGVFNGIFNNQLIPAPDYISREPYRTFIKHVHRDIVSLGKKTFKPSFLDYAGDVRERYRPIVDRGLDFTLKQIPAGIPADGNGIDVLYRNQKLLELQSKFRPKSGSAYTNYGFNVFSNYNSLTEQISNKQQDAADASQKEIARFTNGSAERTITLSMSNSNSYSGKVSGFSPALSPLTKFAQGVRAASIANNSVQVAIPFAPVAKLESQEVPVFDFFEETDLRVLKLWKDYGIIKDASRSAFVFGDIKSIKRTLYLDGYSKGKDHPTSLATWKSCIPGTESSFSEVAPIFMMDIDIYDSYKQEFIATFKDKISTDSSFRKYTQDQLDYKGIKMDNKDIILRHNIENPNVVSLNYSTKNYVASLLTLDVRPELDRQLIGTSRKSVVAEVANEVFDREMLAALLDGVPDDPLEARTSLLSGGEKTEKLVKIIANSINSNKFDDLPSVDIYDTISLVIAAKAFEKPIPSDDKSKNILVTPAENYKNVMREVMDNYTRQLFSINVDTLPFFNHKLFPGKSCGLVGMTGGVLGINPELRHLAPYTGNYSIVGWKHTISSSEISTNLSLIREGFTSTDVAQTSTLAFVKKELQGQLAKLQNNIDKIDESLNAPYWTSNPVQTGSTAGDMFTLMRPQRQRDDETEAQFLVRRAEYNAEYKNKVGYEKAKTRIKALENLIGNLPSS